MKKEYTKQEVQAFVMEVEQKYEENLQNILLSRFFRFRVRSYYSAYLKLRSEWLAAFDAEGMIGSEELTGISRAYERGFLIDEFDCVYFLPVAMKQLIDGEEVIRRLLYYYVGKGKPVRVRLMKELLSDYREKYRKPHKPQYNGLPGRSVDTT